MSIFEPKKPDVIKEKEWEDYKKHCGALKYTKNGSICNHKNTYCSCEICPLISEKILLTEGDKH